MNGKPDTYGREPEKHLPLIFGDGRLGEVGREAVKLLSDLSHDINIRITGEQPLRSALGHLFAAAGLAKRVGRPIDEVYAITESGRQALERVANG